MNNEEMEILLNDWCAALLKCGTEDSCQTCKDTARKIAAIDKEMRDVQFALYVERNR
jgi:hypothetical protein